MTDQNSNTGLTVTLKGGKEFLDPWIVLHASDIADAAAQLGQLDPTTADALAAFDLGLAVAQASVNLQAKVALAKGLNTPAAPAPAPVQAPAPEPVAQVVPQGWGAAPVAQAPVQQYAPQQQAAPAPQQWSSAPQQAPAAAGYAPPQPGPAPIGSDGYEMVWKSGIGKTGKPWKAWMSGAPRDFLGVKAEPQFQR